MKKLTKDEKKALLLVLDKLEAMEKKLNPTVDSKPTKAMVKKQKKAKDEITKVPNEKQIEENLSEGLPSESEKYEGMSYEEVLEKALLAESEAIELNALLIELATDKDIKKFVEILSDENDHSQIYQGVLNRIRGGK